MSEDNKHNITAQQDNPPQAVPQAPSAAPQPVYTSPAAPMPQQQYGYPQGPKTNTMAVVGFVCALVLFFPFTDVAGLVFSIVGLKQTKQTGESGHGLAVAGIIISAIRIALVALWLIILLIGLIAAGASQGSSY